MNRTEILKGIYDHHGEAGLFFSPDYKRLSPSYGIDNPCMEYRGFTIYVDCCKQWKVRISQDEEFLASSKQDAMRQVDDYLRLKKQTK